ncbi:hypothetical protein [Laceyella putida]|uniref:Uncharacterized protein n=1 Tax=Laceyella putida TaxID=110101 RepID=A0ABW2RPM2_9BACL
MKKPMRKNRKRWVGGLFFTIFGVGALLTFASDSEALPPIVVQTPSLQMELEQIDFPPVQAGTEIKAKAQEEE